MPELYGAATADDWSVLVLEDLSSAHWPPPYPDRGEALLETVTAVAATPPPQGVQRRPTGRPLGTYWQRIAADPEPVLAHGLFSAAWLEAAQPVLDAAESSAQLAGDDFLHDDVWAGNVCYTGRGALLIDWASCSIGDRRIDLAYALLSIRSSGTRPPPVDFPDEAAYAVRAGWLHDLEFALAWVSELLQLAPPQRLAG